MIIALKRIGIVLLWLFIIVIAIAFLIITIPVTMPLFLYKTFNKRNIGEGLDSMAYEFRKIAYTFDMLLNVTFFNWIDIKLSLNPYGISREPVSLVLFRRINAKELTQFDKIVIWIIEIFDPNHFDPKHYHEY